jgi:osmotically-inducible protein OsmY
MTDGDAESERVPAKVRAALASLPGLDLQETPVDISFDGEVLTMTGEVAAVADKKRALEAAAAVAGVAGIVDRLHVAPAQPMGDGEIRDHVCDALLGEPAFADCALRVWDDGAWRSLRDPDSAGGRIDVRVDGGVVTLDGALRGLSSKRLAGVLAWWVPGARDVINGIADEPEEEDHAERIAEAVRLVLEKDPFVNAAQIRVGARETVVRLTGLVPSEAERDMAERDAWYVLGVDEVENRIAVKPVPGQAD